MRLLFIFNCLLLASVAKASQNARHKRDLTYLKNLIKSAIFGRSQINLQPPPVLQEYNGYKLYPFLPGYDDIMFKVAPKKAVVEEFVYPKAVKQVNLNAFGSVVGTKSKDDTLVAVKEVNNLLSNGILLGRLNNVIKETGHPMFPSLNTPKYVVEERINAPVIEARPVFTEVIERRPIVEKLIETKPDLVRPLEETVEVQVPVEQILSYKQMQNNEPVMTYIGHTNTGVEVLETINTKTELPMCIKKRVDDAIVMGAEPNRFAPVHETFHYQSPPVVDFSYPRVEANSFEQSEDADRLTPVQEVYEYQTAPVMDFSYPSVDTNLYGQNYFREEIFAEGFETVSDKVRHLKDSPVRYNLRPTKTQAINPRPVPLHSHKYLDFEEDISVSKDKINSETRKVQAFTSSGDKVDLDQTLGPVPPQYFTHVNNKNEEDVVSDEKIMKQTKAVAFVGSKDNVANAKIPINVYKLQINPNTGEVPKESSPLKTNVETKLNQYIQAHTVSPKENKAQMENVVFTNKVTDKSSSVTSPVVVDSTNEAKQVVRENIQISYENTPVVVNVKENENYSYQQNNADGSSIIVKGNNNGISVSVKEKNNRGRGDIPDK